ncbi:hypothetical protein [Pseudomonas fluorescens]|jgi:hypothetical protein|uniref:hypothetical protein n=1 Tax=Pseudomonas fluorescens TaxID=294 RepID=UPI0016567636|nr:hypothetical protein [Pseudomonas fluorescens]MBC8787650.1 hypothetical protein [Pseudomonas fluorescens]
MHKRQLGFIQFFEKYPSAQRHEHEHQNGKLSTVAVGLFEGSVDAGFVGIYNSDGALQSEQNLNLKELEQLVGDASVGHAEVLARLTELAADMAGSPIRYL